MTQSTPSAAGEQPRQLADFEGQWRVMRLIMPASGSPARFEGQATWTAAKDGLDYFEDGMMILEGQAPLQAERRYLWRAGLEVYFDDGRFFHTVPACGGATHHWCEPDSYDMFYDFAEWPRFFVDWRVLGPRKDYAARTEYCRI